MVQHLGFPCEPVQFQARHGRLVNIHYLWIRPLLHWCSAAVSMCQVVRPGICMCAYALLVSASTASPPIPKGLPVLCIVWPSGAVHFASANRIDPRPPSDRQQANGSGFLPVARERREDVTWGMREKESGWVIRKKALKNGADWHDFGPANQEVLFHVVVTANPNTNCMWQFWMQSYN